MQLLYLTFGENITNHIQSQFSIYTFLAQKQPNTSINVLTDQPDFYSSLANQINVLKIDEEILKEWKGEFDFFWRIKIKAIQMICNKHENEPVVYLDSDTFFYGDKTVLQNKMKEGIASMHENESKLSEARSKTEKKMWRQVGHKYYGKIKIQDSHSMWNAGVVATPNTKGGKELTDALEICDEMCRQGVTRRLIEQFALSVALQENYGLAASAPYIAHYWSNKEGWNKVISEFFIQAYFKSYTTDELIMQLETFDFNRLPVKIRIKNTRLRLEKMLGKIFPSKDMSYIRHHHL